MLIDSHCHLEYEGLAEDQPGVLERARAAGIGGFLNISTRRSEWDRVVGTAEREPDVWAPAGRDGFTIPRPGAASRAAVRAGLCRRHRSIRCQSTRRKP